MVVITETFFIVSLCCLLSKRGLRELFRTQFPKMSDVPNSWYLVVWPFLFLKFDFWWVEQAPTLHYLVH